MDSLHITTRVISKQNLLFELIPFIYAKVTDLCALRIGFKKKKKEEDDDGSLTM